MESRSGLMLRGRLLFLIYLNKLGVLGEGVGLWGVPFVLSSSMSRPLGGVPCCMSGAFLCVGWVVLICGVLLFGHKKRVPFRGTRFALNLFESEKRYSFSGYSPLWMSCFILACTKKC